MALLRAAEGVFAAHGVAGTAIEDIAASAGVSTDAFFRHFESKEAVLKEIIEEWFARCTALFAPPGEYPDAPSEPDALLDFCIERDSQIYAFLWQTRPTMRVIHGCQGQYDYMFDAFRSEIRRRNREWLTLWRQDGLIRPDTNIELAALLMSGGYEELSNTMLRAPTRPPFEDWLVFAQDTFLRAWGTPELLVALDRRHPPNSTGVHRASPESSTKRSHPAA